MDTERMGPPEEGTGECAGLQPTTWREGRGANRGSPLADVLVRGPGSDVSCCSAGKAGSIFRCLCCLLSWGQPSAGRAGWDLPIPERGAALWPWALRSLGGVT